MALTYADAEVARKGVIDAYGIYLPGDLAKQVRAMDIRKIVRILPQAQYQIHFSQVFCKFFAAINVVAFGAQVDDPDRPGQSASTGGTKRLIPRLGGATLEDKLTALFRARNALTACNCPAFTSPAMHVLDRNIFVNEDMPITIGTLYHEFVHYFQHPRFYPEFYALGGPNPGILEGVTELFTRRVNPLVRMERENGAKYQNHYDNISFQMGNDMSRRLALIRYSFQGGDYLNLGGLRPRI